MTEAINRDDRFANRFHLDTAPTFVSRSLRKSRITVTEIRSDNPPLEKSVHNAREDAFIAALQLRDFPVHEYWEDGIVAPPAALKAGDTCLYNMKRELGFLMNSPFHSIHFHFPRAALDAVADSAGVPRIGELAYTPGAGTDDPVFRTLVASLRPAFARMDEANRLFVDHITVAAATHVAQRYGGMKTAPKSARGGLAPWQEARAKDILAANLSGEISLDSLAQECRLSSSHFSRAFRQSTGHSPHQWLLHCRVARARELLREQEMVLNDVASACGFADQSHFTRVFSKIAGVSPGAWRRERVQ